jgi:cell fate (sporulation/competence/biofilm development) regulator YlbF (YheA/YmcA/DUF963 family)
MANWRNIIPWGFILPFLIIIGLEILISYGLDFYNQRLSSQIDNLDSVLKQKQESLAESLETNEAFKIFSQTVNLVELLNRNQPLSLIITKFNQIMPNFVNLQSFSYNADEKTIEISAITQSWLDYVRFYQYVTNLKDLELKSFTSPSLNDKNLVNFSMVFFLKPSFFQQ